jgi:hypothetical protein
VLRRSVVIVKIGKPWLLGIWLFNPANLFSASFPRNEEFIDSIRRFAKEMSPSFKR